jgi:hypothetical protein
MKIKLCYLTVCAALFLVFAGSVSVGFGQKIPPGGYFPAKVKNAEVVRAAKFAVNARSETQAANIRLVSIKNAQTQVVAGRNYRLCMKVALKGESGKKTFEQFVQVVVYRNLKNVYSLTSWKVLPKKRGCR